MFYPIILEPVSKEVLWGGNKLSTIYNKNFDFTKNIGESWELSSHIDGISGIKNGSFSSFNIKTLIQSYGDKILGTDIYNKYGNKFPLLIKLIDAADNLSVQVHPGNEYAKIHENDNGKTEMWYVLHAEPETKMVVGLKDGVSKDELKKAIAENQIQDKLNFINIKKGDCLFIPAGTVHSILKGTVLIEIQQSSNITYRLYDWNRTDSKGNSRPLHVEKALSTIDFTNKTNTLINSNSWEVSDEFFTEIPLVQCEYFKTSIYKINSKGRKNGLNMKNDNKAFRTFTVLDGEGGIAYFDKSLNSPKTVEIKKGDTVLIPACLDRTEIIGNLEIILTCPF